MTDNLWVAVETALPIANEEVLVCRRTVDNEVVYGVCKYKPAGSVHDWVSAQGPWYTSPTLWHRLRVN